jgi:protein phosphatase
MTVDPGQDMDVAPGNGNLLDGGTTAYVDWGLCSDQGPMRDHNEDYALADASGRDEQGDAAVRPPLFIVADGLGGHAAGEVASRTAGESARRHWATASVDDAPKALRAAVRAANTAVHMASFEPGRAGMGSTLTALGLAGGEAVIAHVGDSRAYLIRGETSVQLTSDHSRVGEMLRMKLITPEQAAVHPARSQLTRSLGSTPGLQVDLVRREVLPGDVFILCTDGLWGEVAQQELRESAAELAAGLVDAMSAARELVALAVSRGAADNITAVVVRVGAKLPTGATQPRRSLLRWR